MSHKFVFAEKLNLIIEVGAKEGWEYSRLILGDKSSLIVFSKLSESSETTSREDNIASGDQSTDKTSPRKSESEKSKERCECGHRKSIHHNGKIARGCFAEICDEEQDYDVTCPCPKFREAKS